MRHLLTILAALLLCSAPAQAQTLKALMVNATNGHIVATNNDLRFTNAGSVIATSFEAGEMIVSSVGIQTTEYGGKLDFETGEFAASDVLVFSFSGSSFLLNQAFSFTSTNNANTSRTNLGATVIGSAVFTAASATAARQALGLQSYTNTLTNSVNDVEIGSTVSNVTIGWTIAPTNATYAVRTLVGASQTNSITNNSSTLARTGLALTSNTTWTLTVGDGLGATNTATTSVNFLNYMVWGRSTNTTLSNSNIQTLHTNGGDRAFATSRSRSFTMDGSGQYLYVAYPLSFGSATAGGVTHAMIVDGNVFNNFVVTTNTYVNPQGFTNTYLIYRTANIINGSGVAFTVQ